MFSWREGILIYLYADSFDSTVQCHINTQLGLILKLILNLLGMCWWKFPSLYSAFLHFVGPQWASQGDWIQGDWKTNLLSLDLVRTTSRTIATEFKEFVHSHGHNSLETRTKTTVFVMWRYRYLVGALIMCALIGVGALINKNTFEGELLLEGGPQIKSLR